MTELPPRAGLVTVQRVITENWKQPQGIIKPHAVYVLECDLQPDDDKEGGEFKILREREKELTRRANRWVNYNDDEKSWIEETIHSDRAFYVGSSTSPVERIIDHIWGQGANFTVIFPPTAIFAIRWYSTSDEVRKKEEDIAEELQNPSRFSQEISYRTPELGTELLDDIDDDIYVYQN